MRRLLIVLVLLFAGCEQEITIDLGFNVAPHIFRQDYDYPDYEVERPTVNLETIFRQENWLGPQGEGSCVHATMIMLLRWQGQYEIADYWKATHADGEYASNLADKMDRAGVRYAYTSRKNEVSFLEWACKTRRGCGVAVRNRAHMVMLVHMDEQNVCILDNNFPENFKWIPRETFMADWLSSGSWAVTPIMGPPPPPLPFD
jgi:hypothetical protein